MAVVLLMAGAGCESLQKKFIRKRKQETRPSPIITFEDYTRTMTSLDKYRKHYLLFNYWNGELISVLQERDANPKRARRASGESLQELGIMRGLLTDTAAARVTPLIEERERLDRQLQRGLSAPSELGLAVRQLERQTREVHRSLFWRDVEDQLKDDAKAPPIDAGGH